MPTRCVVASLHTTDSHMLDLQPDGSRLQGWNFIQEKMLSHDEDMIADYADDIDTLLVFVSIDCFVAPFSEGMLTSHPTCRQVSSPPC